MARAGYEAPTSQLRRNENSGNHIINQHRPAWAICSCYLLFLRAVALFSLYLIWYFQILFVPLLVQQHDKDYGNQGSVRMGL